MLMVRFAVPPKVTLPLIVATPVLLLSDTMLPLSVIDPFPLPAFNVPFLENVTPLIVPPLAKATVPLFGNVSVPVVFTEP